MQQMVIMQGLPGSGKGYISKRDYPNHRVCSADNFFRKLNPNYDKGGEGFDPTKLGQAHKACFSEAHKLLNLGFDVVIDNTNLDNESIAPYVSLAGLHGAQVTICRVECSTAVAMERNTHGVPPQAYPRMASAFKKWQMWAPHKFGGVKLRVVDNEPVSA